MGDIWMNPLTSKIAGQAILLTNKWEIIEHVIFAAGRLHLIKFKRFDI